jgi:hypothetical protein
MTNLTYKDEALLLSWSDSAAGRKVTFLLPDAGEEHPFKGFKTGPTNGQAFALACHPVDYDNPEQPEQPKPGDQVKSVAGYAKPPMTESQRCGMLCNDERFQIWLSTRFPLIWDEVEREQRRPFNDMAAEVVRRHCIMNTRRKLDENGPSAEVWLNMLAQFESDTGRMAERTR